MLHMDENEEYSRVKNWVDNSKTLRIFIFGKLGAGKSTLINSLLNKDVADVGSGLDAVTTKVEDHAGKIARVPYRNITIHDIDVTLWDTPGLQDPRVNKQSLLADIRDNVTDNEDLYVYCMQMTQTRMEQGDFDSIAELTDVLGVNFWKTSLFALTFANDVIVPPSIKGNSLENYFEGKVKEWEKHLRTAVLNANVEKSDVDRIPVVPVGYKKEPVPGLRSKDRWFTSFWKTCLQRMKFMSIPAFLTVNKDEWAYNQSQGELAARVITYRLQMLADELDRKVELDEVSPLTLGGISPDSMAMYLKRAILGADAPDNGSVVELSGRLATRNARLAMVAVASLAAVLAFLYWRRKHQH